MLENCKFSQSNKESEFLEPKTERAVGENAGAPVPHQQMNPLTPRYPVDRYLVERSNKFEMVNIDDDIWNAEPALRPEDEIMLRKLHDMLQSTADDLKLLSGELSKYHEPGVQVRSLPMPLDEDFNEKVHIEEIVNAKFHGYKIVDSSSQNTPKSSQKKVIGELLRTITKDTHKPKKVVSTGIQVNNVPMPKKTTKTRNLAVSRTKTFEIQENDTNNTNNVSKNEMNKKRTPAVAYNEFSFKYVEPTIQESFSKCLRVQNMPSINIRSELREQKVLNLNIEPEIIDKADVACKHNISVISIQHEPTNAHKTVPKTNHNQVQFHKVPTVRDNKEPTRKVSKMSSCESSESISNNFTHSGRNICHQTRPQKVTAKIVRTHNQSHENVKSKRKVSERRETTNHSSLDEWKKKLNAVYGRPTSSRLPKSNIPERKGRRIETNNSSTKCQQIKNINTLNNADYIPYSKLTLGGARVSDIEKELSDIPNRNDIPLSPIVHKILSRENSFRNESSQDDIVEGSPKILTTSDENLLQEVLDIEKKVNKTLSKNTDDNTSPRKKDGIQSDLHDYDNQDSYADDFEDEKTDHSNDSEMPNQFSDISEEMKEKPSEEKCVHSKKDQDNEKNRTHTKKAINLSFKNKVDIFEFVHSVDTQETGTQSQTNKKISPKETQTSPRNESSNVQPIHNDLWPSIDPRGEVQKLFDLEKDFIKKLIIDEYGDLLAKNLNKPSTSKDNHVCGEKNVVASQKNTQTSPGHVKSCMTSPTRTKTRTTSPFAMSLTVDKQTSPIMIEELQINIEDGDDLGISINLSSPRFSLRLPQSSREVISNLESHVQSKKTNETQLNRCEKNNTRLPKAVRNASVSSSSSIDGDYSSSDISSLGEVKLKLNRTLRKLQVPSVSEVSSTSLSKSSSDVTDNIIPLRSEGEISLGQLNRGKNRRNNASEGEMSLGRMH